MLSSVLRNKRADLVNVEIMRAFVRLRQMLASHADLAEKLSELEKKYDAQFKIVFDAIRQLMAPPTRNLRPIGFDPAVGTLGSLIRLSFYAMETIFVSSRGAEDTRRKTTSRKCGRRKGICAARPTAFGNRCAEIRGLWDFGRLVGTEF